MGINPIINFAIRGTQALFAIIVLGLSVDLIRGHKSDDLPGTLGFAAFVGGISIVAACIGIASTWVETLQGVIGTAIDGVVAVINLAAGVIIAVKLKGVNCGDNSDVYRHFVLDKIDILNGGCDGSRCYYWNVEPNKLNTRCKQSQADMAFMFMLCVALIASGTLAFLKSR